MTFEDDSGFLCVYVGRISNEKRLDVIIEAVKGLTGSKAYLAIVGDGPTAPQYASLHGATNRIYCKPRFLSHEELAEVGRYLRHKNVLFIICNLDLRLL